MSEIKETTITIPLAVNKAENPIQYKTNADGKKITHLKTRSVGTTLNDDVIATDVFPSAFLLLVRSNETLLEIPLEYIKKHTDAAFQPGYPVEFSDVDWNRSKICIKDVSTITAGEVIELTIRYID